MTDSPPASRSAFCITITRNRWVGRISRDYRVLVRSDRTAETVMENVKVRVAIALCNTLSSMRSWREPSITDTARFWDSNRRHFHRL